MNATRRRLRENGLTLGFLLLFLVCLLGQAVAGHAEYVEQLRSRGADPISLVDYVGTSDFAADVAENWQSEYLQFLLFVVLTVWLTQKGSPESKDVDKAGTETDEEQRVGAFAREDSPLWAKAGGWRTAVYSNSLGLLMGAIFLLSWFAQSVAGRAAFNVQQLGEHADPVSYLGYLGSPDFWSRSLQNWQSEMLAVASMTAFAIYLRQRGSPESKPVGASHAATGVEAVLTSVECRERVTSLGAVRPRLAGPIQLALARSVRHLRKPAVRGSPAELIGVWPGGCGIRRGSGTRTDATGAPSWAREAGWPCATCFPGRPPCRRG